MKVSQDIRDTFGDASAQQEAAAADMAEKSREFRARGGTVHLPETGVGVPVGE